MSEYSKVMDMMQGLADKMGKSNPSTAWLMLEGVWWPNPYYKGESVAHPECETEFHPPKGPSLKERFKKFQEEK